MDTFEIAENIKRICKEKGTTPTVACSKSGAGKSMVSNMKKGTRPSIAKMQLLADFLGVTVNELLGEKEKPTPLWGSGLSSEALEVAAAYDQAAKKDQDTVRFILADYLPRAAAARGDIDLSKEDLSGVTVAGEDPVLP